MAPTPPLEATGHPTDEVCATYISAGVRGQVLETQTGLWSYKALKELRGGGHVPQSREPAVISKAPCATGHGEKKKIHTHAPLHLHVCQTTKKACPSPPNTIIESWPKKHDRTTSNRRLWCGRNACTSTSPARASCANRLSPPQGDPFFGRNTAPPPEIRAVCLYRHYPRARSRLSQQGLSGWTFHVSPLLLHYASAAATRVPHLLRHMVPVFPPPARASPSAPAETVAVHLL